MTTLNEIAAYRKAHMREIYESLNGDKIAIALAAKVGAIDESVLDDEPHDDAPTDEPDGWTPLPAPQPDPVLEMLRGKLGIATDTTEE